MPELTSLTVKEMLLGLEQGAFTSLELTRACLQRIETHEPALHAFITLTPDLALEQAQKADSVRKDLKTTSKPTPTLLGLPIAVKDLLSLKGVRLTCGSRMLENYIPPYTATTVQRLLDAGVVVLGKTNTDEYAMGSSTENSAYGPTHNPWDQKRVPGGSSGGSAAAVSARLVPAAMGTDTGGSVRQPASFCGVTGIKPSYGRTSRFGLVAYGSSLDTVGIFANTAEDVALLFQVMAGHDPHDATTLDVPVPAMQFPKKPDLHGLKVGLPKEYFIEGIQPEVERAVRVAVEKLRELGASVLEVSLPHTSYALPVYYLIAPAEASANLARYDGVRFGPGIDAATYEALFERTRGRAFGAEVKRRIMLGTYALSTGYYDAYYNQAQKVRTLIKQDFEDAFKEVDVIAAPIAPTTAFKLGQHTDDPLAMYLEDVFTLPANLAGVPGVAFPVGFDGSDLPIGMQLMGRHFDESTLFNAAHAYQLVTTWHTRQPIL